MLILTSNLTGTPRYYASRSYRVRYEGNKSSVLVTGKKWDVTAQIEQIIADRKKQ